MKKIKIHIEEPKLIKNKEIIEFATELDQMFVDSMPDTRKFIRLALPGEVDGKLPVLTLRTVFQNDEGALFKGLLLPPWGQYQPRDLTQLCMINNCDFEQLFYKSYKITMEKEVKYTWRQQTDQLFNAIIDTIAFKDDKQIHSHIWHCVEDSGSLPLGCAPIITKSGHKIMFFDAKHVTFDASLNEDLLAEECPIMAVGK
jgi:hypothetical protein